MKELITDILKFCDENKVESITFPPLASGILGFKTKPCAKAFFEGTMDFLDDNDCITTLKKINIAVIEKDKHKEFQEEWINCFVKKYGAEIPSSDEEAAPEVSSDSEEETKVTTSKKPAAQGVKKGVKKFDMSSSDDEDVKVQTKKQPVKKPATKVIDSDSSDSPPPVKKNSKVASKAVVISSDSDSDKPKASKKKDPPKIKKGIMNSDSESDNGKQKKKPAAKPKIISSSDSDSDSKKKPAKKSNVKNTAPKKKVLLSSSDSD